MDGAMNARVVSGGTGRLWLGAIGVLLWFGLTAWLGRPDDGCPAGLGLLPQSATDAAGFASCAGGSLVVPFLLADLVLIVGYLVVLRWCARWCADHLRSPRGRALGRVAAPLVVAAAAVDVVEDVLLLAALADPGPVRVPVIVASGLKWALLIVPLAAGVVALGYGFRRFAMPWTVPPDAEPELVDGIPAAVPGVSPENGPTGWYVEPGSDGRPQPFPGADYGVGLSGGGIRSAAFCSGVLQSLDGTEWSPSRARYLATVSGGGYVGVSTQMIRHCAEARPVVPDPHAGTAPETGLVRERQRYLGDGLDKLRFVVAFLVGIGLNLVLVAGPLLLAGAVLAAVLPAPPVSGRTALTIAAAVALLVAAVLWQLCTAEQDAASAGAALVRSAGVLRAVSGGLTLAGCVVLLWTVPLGRWWLAPLAAFVVVGWTSLRIARRRLRAGIWNRVAQASFSSAWITVALAVVALPASGRLDTTATWTAPVVGAGIVIYLVIFLLSDQTWWSPHPFYKARIAGTFALKRSPDAPGAAHIPFATYTYLDEWAAPREGEPELLVCATANLEDLSVPPAGSRAVPFVFTHDTVGSPEIGWWRGRDLRRALGSRLAADGTLQAATAISGAAVASSGTGVRGRIPTVGTLLALTNVRLGVWLPNPRGDHDWPASGFAAGWLRRRRPIWLWREVAGLLPGRKRFVYVSDGGHLDNLGLLELLRRRTRRILVVDASGDAGLSTDTLDWVLDMAGRHLGVEVERDSRAPLTTEARPSGLALPAEKESVDCVERIAVRYPCGEHATIVVAKARFATTLADDPEAREVAEAVVQARHPAWPWSMGSLPTTSTTNQFLTDAQFDGYVKLGRAVGRRVVGMPDDLPSAPPARGPADAATVISEGARLTGATPPVGDAASGPREPEPA